MSRLVLGTAQFGLDYGVTNRRGKIGREEVATILDAAYNSGITTLDTATGYGDSEEILGVLNAHERFRIVTKIAPDTADDVRPQLDQCCESLRAAVLDTVLLHNFQQFEKSPEIWRAMNDAHRQGSVKRIGISLYYPWEWDRISAYCDSHGLSYPDAVQFPLSVFDQRFVSFLPKIKAAGTEIFVRSVFLQGLGFSSKETLPEFFRAATDSLRLLADIEKSTGMNRAAALLGFPLSRDEIDHIVIGVDGIETFYENVRAFSVAESYSASINATEWSRLAIDDDSILIPMNWPKDKL